MNENPLVSIVVAIYNVEAFLDVLITSLFNQTYKNLEIILVEDGSPDNSGKICDDFSKKDNRIKVIHQNNNGVSNARNRGMEIANGKYITFVDGDDWLEPDFIEYMLKIIVETNSDMAISTNNFTSRDRKQIDNDSIEIWEPTFCASRFLYPGIAIGCWNKIYRTDFLKTNNIKFTMQISGEGMHLIVTSAHKANHIGVGHRKVYNYRLNNTNSALTKPNLRIGTYALKSIMTIRDELIINDSILLNAVNWHIWINYGFTLYFIIATNSKKENKKLFNDCRRNLLLRLPKALIKSEVN